MLPSQFFKLLSDETRVRCLLLISRENVLCVCELTYALEESQPKISRHLAKLKALGLLVDERKGQWINYRLAQDLPGWMNNIIESLKDSHCLKTQYQRDSVRLSTMSNRPSGC